MKIIATNHAEFDKLEEIIKCNFTDIIGIDTVEYSSLVGSTIVTFHRSFERDFKILVPSKWGFWKVYITERNEEVEGKSKIDPRYVINVLCKDMTLKFPSSSNVFTLEIIEV